MGFDHVGNHQHSVPAIYARAPCGNAPLQAGALMGGLRRPMAEVKHYRLQADRAKRLARQVTDDQVRQRLLETADEYTRFAALLEARSSDRRSRRELSHADT